ncbi:hypothetical protein PG993_004534 [Apiospora rasikravindrae]|uniref:Uncharacterized protein n=1 Tax=Apiospora rasikravindrae TaxID=990691 RepID=A0ABR1TF14_9PEZI
MSTSSSKRKTPVKAEDDDDLELLQELPATKKLDKGKQREEVAPPPSTMSSNRVASPDLSSHTVIQIDSDSDEDLPKETSTQAPVHTGITYLHEEAIVSEKRGYVHYDEETHEFCVRDTNSVDSTLLGRLDHQDAIQACEQMQQKANGGDIICTILRTSRPICPKRVPCVILIDSDMIMASARVVKRNYWSSNILQTYPEPDLGGIIATNLYAYQKDTLRGMKKFEESPIDKETLDAKGNITGREGKTMWREWVQVKGDKPPVVRFYNSCTRTLRSERPDAVRGGILALEMGLGKTLICISLIASDRGANAGQSMGPTLVVAPSVLLDQWREQVVAHVARRPDSDQPVLSVRLYRESARCRDPDVIKQDDITIRRIILDEASAIKNSNTGKYKAVVALKGERRWAVTATPVNNGSDDMGSLFGFLKTPPFETPQQFKNKLVTPLKSGTEGAEKTLPRVVECHMLCNTKKELDMRLNSVTHIQAEVELTREEESIYREEEQKFRQRVTHGPNSVHHVLTLIHNLRYSLALGVMNSKFAKDEAADLDRQDQLYSHGIVASPPTDGIVRSLLESAEENGNELDLKCTTCKQPIAFSNEPVNDSGTETKIAWCAPCGRCILCPPCAAAHDPIYRERILSAKGKHAANQCPMCQGVQQEAGGVELVQAVIKPRASNRRVDALIHDLVQRERLTEANPDQPPYKSIVFSQWSKPLGLVTQELDAKRIKHVLLTGGGSSSKRKATIASFKNDPSVHVLVCTTGVAGHGLDLPMADTVFLLDPLWNPATEKQCTQRIDRIGQTRSMRVVRYIIRNTIEKDVQEVQNEKKTVEEFILGSGESNDTGVTLETVRKIFGKK